MILILRSGPTTVVAQNWSAGCNDGAKGLTVRTHDGFVGIRMSLEQFLAILSSASRSKPLDLRSWCEAPEETKARNNVELVAMGIDPMTGGPLAKAPAPPAPQSPPDDLVAYKDLVEAEEEARAAIVGEVQE